MLNILKRKIPEASLALLLARWIVHNNSLLEIKDLIEKENIQWKRFNEFLAYHELSSFGYPCFKNFLNLLPPDQVCLLNRAHRSSLASTLYFLQEFVHIICVFNDKGIKILPIKGTNFLVDNLYVDKTGLRPMCDIDLLIRKEELPLVEKTLEASGYKKSLGNLKEDYWRRKNYHLVFIRRKDFSYIVEIHWALDYKRDKPILADLWKRIRKAQVGTKDVYLLSVEDTLFSLALHQRRFGKMLCLKNVCDVAMLLNRYNPEFDWDYILKEARLGKMQTTLYFILAQVSLLLGANMPSSLLKALDVPKYKRRLIERFILKHTFTFEPDLNNNGRDINNLYLKSHFLLYDNLWEPVRCILNLPQEQFAKFYGLPPYAMKTNLLYRIRYPYFIKHIFLIILHRLQNMNIPLNQPKRLNYGLGD